MDLQRMGQRLREARLASHLRQSQVAEMVGVNESTIGRWEKGETEPNDFNKRRLCEIFRKKERELFGESEKVTIMPQFPPAGKSGGTPASPTSPNVSLNRAELFPDQSSLCLELQITLPAGMQQQGQPQQPTTEQPTTKERRLQPFVAPGMNGSVEISVPAGGTGGTSGQQQITVTARIYKEALSEAPIRQRAAGGGDILPFTPPRRPHS